MFPGETTHWLLKIRSAITFTLRLRAVEVSRTKAHVILSFLVSRVFVRSLRVCVCLCVCACAWLLMLPSWRLCLCLSTLSLATPSRSSLSLCLSLSLSVHLPLVVAHLKFWCLRVLYKPGSRIDDQRFRHTAASTSLPISSSSAPSASMSSSASSFASDDFSKTLR